MLLTGCSSLQYPLDIYLGPPPRAEAAVHWLPLYSGVDIAQLSLSHPPLHLWAVRVNLADPGVSVVVTPSNGPRPLDTDGRTTAAFLRDTGARIAVNASPFGPVADTPGASEDIEGISAAGGNIYSPPAKEGGALVIDGGGRAWILDQAALTDSADVRAAVGGFAVILRNGRNLGSTDHRHPRTAAGVSPDHRLLYLVVVDGRQLAWSVGVTTRELAAWLKLLGASDGLNLDGGGSTALVARLPDGTPAVINSPIDGLVPGRLRVVGNNLGILAPSPTQNRALYDTLRSVAADPSSVGGMQQ